MGCNRSLIPLEHKQIAYFNRSRVRIFWKRILRRDVVQNSDRIVELTPRSLASRHLQRGAGQTPQVRFLP